MEEALTQITELQAAKAFLEIKGTDEMSDRKLQKLIYLAHENHVKQSGKGLLVRPKIRAEASGPVIKNLEKYISNTSKKASLPKDLNIEPIAEDTKQYLKEVYEIFRDMSGEDLSDITHFKTSAWYAIRNKGKGFFARILNVDSGRAPRITNKEIRGMAA